MADINVKTITLNKLTQEQYDSATINPNEFYLVTNAPESLTKAVADTLYAPISLSETVSTLSSTVDTKANSADVYKKSETYSQSEVDSKLAEKLDTSVASTTYATIATVDTKADADNVYDKATVDEKLNAKLDSATASTTYATQATVNGHISNTDNPHNVTKAQVGLGNVDNTSDLNKPISTATQTALNLKANSADVYTKSEVDAKLASALHFKGTVSTVGDLNNVQDPQIGDMYNVDATGANYAWDGSEWDKLSETIDLTPFLTKEEASSTYATITTVNGIEEVIPEAASSNNKLVDNQSMTTALAGKADTSSLGTMASKDADDYSTTEEANLLYLPIQSSVTDTSSTSITLDNADANTVYHYGTLDSLTITAADISDLETVIWFTPSANLTGITIPETLQPLNEFNPVAGKLACLSILNGTIVYGSVL